MCVDRRPVPIHRNSGEECGGGADLDKMLRDNRVAPGVICIDLFQNAPERPAMPVSRRDPSHTEVQRS